MQNAIADGGRAQEEVDKLNEQLRSHQESIRILVEEKSQVDLTNKKLEADLQESKVQIDNLKAKNEQLEMDSLKQSHDQASSEGLKLAEAEVEAARRLLGSKEAELQERDGDLQELKSRLLAKESLETQLKEELKEKSSKLELAEVNLEQLRRSAVTDDDNSCLQDKVKDLESKNEELTKREAELTAYIQQAGRDREQIIHQYTTYCQQLTAQMEAVNEQLAGKISEADALAIR